MFLLSVIEMILQGALNLDNFKFVEIFLVNIKIA